MLAEPYSVRPLRTFAASQQQEAQYVPMHRALPQYHQPHQFTAHQQQQQQSHFGYAPQQQQQHHLAMMKPQQQQQQQQLTPAQQQQQRHVLADRYKTKMCRNYLTHGACPYESRCMFAHGEHEMRTTEQNLRDGLTTEENIKAFQRAAYSGRKNNNLNLQQQQQQQQQQQTKTIAGQCACEHCEVAQQQQHHNLDGAERSMTSTDGVSAAAASTVEDGPVFAHNPYSVVVLCRTTTPVEPFFCNCFDCCAADVPVVEDWSEWCDDEAASAAAPVAVVDKADPSAAAVEP